PPDPGVLLGDYHELYLRPGSCGRAVGAGRGSNGHSSGVLPAHHHGSGQYQQRAGPRLRHSHRFPGGLRLDIGHDSHESEHDAHADGQAAADATVAARKRPQWARLLVRCATLLSSRIAHHTEPASVTTLNETVDTENLEFPINGVYEDAYRPVVEAF